MGTGKVSRIIMSPLLLCKQLLRERHVEVDELPIGLRFRYQGGNFLVVDNEEDQQYLQLVMPNIYEVTNTVGRQMCLEALNKVNGSLKVGKAVLR